MLESRAYEKLASVIQSAAWMIQPVPDLPQMAPNVTGKTYTLGQAFLGWSDMTFFFEQGLDQATLKKTSSPDLEIGLDNPYWLAETPNSRAVAWIESDMFYLDCMVFGDLIRTEACSACAQCSYHSLLDSQMSILIFGYDAFHMPYFDATVDG